MRGLPDHPMILAMILAMVLAVVLAMVLGPEGT